MSFGTRSDIVFVLPSIGGFWALLEGIISALVTVYQLLVVRGGLSAKRRLM